MEKFCPAGHPTGTPSFSALFSRQRPPPPEDRAVSTATKSLTEAEMEISGRSLVDVKWLSLVDLNISDDHTLQWAMNILDSYSPSPLQTYQHYWSSNQLDQKAPFIIESEPDTCLYFTV